MSDDITRLPPINKRIGSCPECGKPIWESDKTFTHFELLGIVYKCIECEMFWKLEEIIPF